MQGAIGGLWAVQWQPAHLVQGLHRGGEAKIHILVSSTNLLTVVHQTIARDESTTIKLGQKNR